MTQLTENIAKILRKLARRQLTAKEMDMAQKGTEVHSSSIDKRIVYSARDDELVVDRTYYIFATTDDFSHREIKHTGYYPHYHSIHIYTPEGLLKETHICDGRGQALLNTGYCTKHKTYNPPGSFIGQRK